MIGVRVGVGHQFAGGFDPSASAYFAATGITGATEQQAVNTLVTSLKSAGLWSKMKAVYPFVTDNRNLLGYTNTFSSLGSYQTDGTITLTENYATAPNGTNTATRMYGNAASSYIYNSVTIAALGGTGNKVLSVYLKAGSDTQVAIGINSDGTTSQTTCNLTSSWQRFEVTKNVVSTSGNYSIFIGNLGQSQDIIAWGIQYESGSTATTYQPIATTQQSYISNQFKYNLVNPVDSDAAFRGVFNGGWTFSNQGALPNGTNGYMDTNLNISNEFASQTQSFSFYTPVSNTTANVLGGVSNGTSTTQFYNPIGQYNILGTAYVKGSAMSNGFILMSQPSANNTSAYEKGVKLGNFSQTTSALMNFNYYIGARNLSNISDSYANRQYSFAHIGQGLTDTEATALYNAVQTFNTSLSRQV